MVKTQESFGVRLKRIRKAGKYTVIALATKAGISPQTIKDLEAGRTDPGIKSLTALAKAFDLSIEELKGEEEVFPAQAVPILSPKKALSMYLKIPDEIVERAQAHDLSSKVWELVKIAFDEVESLQAQKQQTKKSRA